MRRILDEVARMKKIAGIISEDHYEEGKNDHAKKLEKIALKVYDKIENSVDVEDDMLQMSKREIAEFVPKGAPVKAIVDLVHSYMRGNMPLPDDFDEMEEGVDMATSEEITMEGDEVTKAKGIKEASLPGGMMPTSGDNADLSVDLNSPSVADMADDFQGNMDAFAKYIQTALQDAGIKAQAQVKFKPIRVDIKLMDASQLNDAVGVLNAQGLQFKLL